MIVYIFVLGIIYLASLINLRKIKLLDVVFFVFITAVSGFRYGVGTDYFNYVRYFNQIESGYNAPAEPGFNYLAMLIAKLTLNSQALFLVFSVLTMFFFYRGLKYYLNNDFIFKPVLYIVFVIFTYIPSLNGIRQALAAAIIFYASKYIIEKKFFKYSLYVLFASLFHLSSLIFLALYFIVKRDYNKILLLFVLFLSLFLAKSGFINQILEIILLNFSYLDFGGYINNMLYSSYNDREVDFGIVFFINFTVLVVLTLLKDKLITNELAQLSFNFFFLYILSYVLSMDASMLTRLTYYFSIYMAVSISRFGILFDSNSRKVVEYVLFGLYSLLFLYVILNGYFNPGQTDFIPYDSNFNIFNN